MTRRTPTTKPWLLPEPLENASPDRPLCQKCGLFKLAKTPFMRPYIPEGYTHRALGIGEAPGGDEDERSGRPFSGKAGKLLAKKLKETGWEERDVALHNAVICRPLNNAEPTMTQIRCCRPFLLQVIRDLNPRFIIGFGTIAAKALTNNGQAKVTSLRGRPATIPQEDSHA